VPTAAGVSGRSWPSSARHLRRCRLTSADFYGAKSDGARWYDCDLTDVDVSQSRIADVRLHGSTLTGLRGAKHLSGMVIDP